MDYISSLNNKKKLTPNKRSEMKGMKKKKSTHWTPINLHAFGQGAAREIAVFAAISPPVNALILHAQREVEKHTHEG